MKSYGEEKRESVKTQAAINAAEYAAELAAIKAEKIKKENSIK